MVPIDTIKTGLGFSKSSVYVYIAKLNEEFAQRIQQQKNLSVQQTELLENEISGLKEELRLLREQVASLEEENRRLTEDSVQLNMMRTQLAACRTAIRPINDLIAQVWSDMDGTSDK